MTCLVSMVYPVYCQHAGWMMGNERNGLHDCRMSWPVSIGHHSMLKPCKEGYGAEASKTLRSCVGWPELHKHRLAVWYIEK